MKNLNLNSLGVQEINSKEMKKIDGGFIAITIFGITIAAELVYSAIAVGTAIGCTVAGVHLSKQK